MSETNDITADSGADALLSRVTSLLSGHSGPLDDKNLWTTIAASYSAEWRKAHEELLRAENPNNQPLGPIDKALEPEEDRDARVLKQVAFTAIDEELRGTLRDVFVAAKQRYNVLEISLRLSEDVAGATEDLSEPDLPAVSLTRMFGLSSLSLFRKSAEPEKNPA